MMDEGHFRIEIIAVQLMCYVQYMHVHDINFTVVLMV